MKYYIDCEFDGHKGPLLSIAMVRQDGESIYVRTTLPAFDPWVLNNVVPVLDKHMADMAVTCDVLDVADFLANFIGWDDCPTIIADSPVDIGRFCVVMSTDHDGGWRSCDYTRMLFEVHNVQCYPTGLQGAVQHNAWWDALALKEKLEP